MKNKIFFITILIIGLLITSAYVSKQRSFLTDAMASFTAEQDSSAREEEAKERFLQQTKEADKRAAQEYLRQQ